MSEQTPQTPIENSDAWEAHLAYSLGFVARTEEEARGVLALFPDEDAIDRIYGDSQPREIVVVRGSAKPRPQFDGDEFPRLPGSYYANDCIPIVRDFDTLEDSDAALLAYEAALGAAERLNRLASSADVFVHPDTQRRCVQRAANSWFYPGERECYRQHPETREAGQPEEGTR